MQHHPIAHITRTTALMACVAAFMFALAGSAAAVPDLRPGLSEHSGQQAAPIPNPRVGDTPADRVAPTAAATTQASSTSSDDGDGNAPLIVGISVMSVALLASGVYVVRRRGHLAPGH